MKIIPDASEPEEKPRIVPLRELVRMNSLLQTSQMDYPGLAR
jgi:hypothetical protein